MAETIGIIGILIMGAVTISAFLIIAIEEYKALKEESK